MDGAALSLWIDRLRWSMKMLIDYAIRSYLPPMGPEGVRSLWRRFLNQFDTWVIVSPVLLASVRFSSGVG